MRITCCAWWCPTCPPSSASSLNFFHACRAWATSSLVLLSSKLNTRLRYLFPSRKTQQELQGSRGKDDMIRPAVIHQAANLHPSPPHSAALVVAVKSLP